MEEEINKDINKQWGVIASMITFAGQTPVQHLFSWKTDSRRENARWHVFKIVFITIFDRRLSCFTRWYSGKKLNKLKYRGECIPFICLSLFCSMLIWMPENKQITLQSLFTPSESRCIPYLSFHAVWCGIRALELCLNGVYANNH